MTKLDKAYKIINSRLPKWYPRPELKTYKSAKGMMLAEAHRVHEPYQDVVKYYAKYGKRKNQKYIHSKYFCTKGKGTWKDTIMLAGDPIAINLGAIKSMQLEHVIFVLLHEIGHLYYTPKGRGENERLADKFAIRWIKVFISECLIRDYVNT